MMILDPRSQEVLIPDRSLGADQSLDSTFLQVVSIHAALLPPSTPHPSKWGILIFVSDFLSGPGIDCQRRWSYTSSSENVDD